MTTHEVHIEKCKRPGFADLYWMKCSAFRHFEEGAKEPVCNFETGYYPKDRAMEKALKHEVDVRAGTYTLSRSVNGNAWP